MMKTKIVLGALLLCATAFVDAPVHAQLVVETHSEARACYMKAVTDLAGRGASIRTCEKSLSEENLDRKDRAATYVNKGILQMRRGDHTAALAAYDSALKLKPKLAEAHINRGACLIYLSRPEEAIDALSISIDLDSNHLPDALYNRAVAYERLGQIKPAYKDFKRAADLRPDWDAPTQALERFQVVTKRAQ